MNSSIMPLDNPILYIKQLYAHYRSIIAPGKDEILLHLNAIEESLVANLLTISSELRYVTNRLDLLNLILNNKTVVIINHGNNLLVIDEFTVHESWLKKYQGSVSYGGSKLLDFAELRNGRQLRTKLDTKVKICHDAILGFLKLATKTDLKSSILTTTVSQIITNFITFYISDGICEDAFDDMNLSILRIKFGKYASCNNIPKCPYIQLINVNIQKDSNFDETLILELRDSTIYGIINSVKLQKLSIINSQLVLDSVWGWMPNLTELCLDRCSHVPINKATFRGLSSLKVLVIRTNNLLTIEDYAFSSLPNLVYLEISDTHLYLITSLSLTGMSNLETLILINNGIRNVSDEAFRDLCKLKILDLSYNQITGIYAKSSISLVRRKERDMFSSMLNPLLSLVEFRMIDSYVDIGLFAHNKKLKIVRVKNLLDLSSGESIIVEKY